jgi:hypothetical protein
MSLERPLATLRLLAAFGRPVAFDTDDVVGIGVDVRPPTSVSAIVLYNLLGPSSPDQLPRIKTAHTIRFTLNLEGYCTAA